MTNIMMLHNGRCGSTVVGDLLAQNPNIHWASELYEPIIAKWKEENQQEFAYLAKELIVKNPIELLKNSMHKTTKPYYGVVVKPFHFAIAHSSATEFLNQLLVLLLSMQILADFLLSTLQLWAHKAQKPNVYWDFVLINLQQQYYRNDHCVASLY